jgi:hypothetical protein
MLSRFIHLAAFAFSFCICFLLHSAQAQVGPQNGPAAPIGKVISASGSVTIEHTAPVALQANISGPQPNAKVGDFVYQGDVVQTGTNSKAGITFTDGTAFNLSSDARMELNEFVYAPSGGPSNSSFFTLSKGTFTFVAGTVAKTGDMKVDTAMATVGIRGTTPHVEITEDGRVKFSTLIEDKEASARAGQAQPPGRGAPRRQRRSSASPDPLTRQQANSYDRLFKVQTNFCRGC